MAICVWNILQWFGCGLLHKSPNSSSSDSLYIHKPDTWPQMRSKGAGKWGQRRSQELIRVTDRILLAWNPCARWEGACGCYSDTDLKSLTWSCYNKDWIEVHLRVSVLLLIIVYADVQIYKSSQYQKSGHYLCIFLDLYIWTLLDNLEYHHICMRHNTIDCVYIAIIFML